MRKLIKAIDRAARVIAFIETLRCPDGTQAGQPLVLRPWQRKVIYAVYGPCHPDGRRIVRQALLSMARKNGKTALVAALCLCHLCGPEAVRNGQLYSVAYDREQAAILFKYMAAMIYLDEELAARLNVIESRKRILDPVSGSEFVALSSETRGKHGKSSSFIVFDELAQYGADRELYDVMMTSRGAHAEPLVWVISTQAPDDFAVLSELIDYGLKVERGEIEDPSFRAFIHEVPLDADPFDESLWHLANPALGDFRSLEEMRETADKARCMPSAMAAFRNLYLNQRIDAAAHFITPEVWKACGEAVRMETFEEAEAVGGLDLSAKNDLTALVLVALGPDSIWDVLPLFFTPKDSLREREAKDRAPYCTWSEKGFLEAVPGRTIDYRYVALKVGELLSMGIRLGKLKFDRWRIDDFKRALVEEGVQAWVLGKDWSEEAGERGESKPDGLMLVPHGQGYRDMNPAVETLEDLAVEGKLRHGNHPVLTWCVANTRVQSDPAGNRKFDKIRSTGRIDGCVALGMALNGAVSVAVAEPVTATQAFVEL